MKNNDIVTRRAVALGDFDGMHKAHKTVITGAENTVIYCVNNKFSLLQKSLFKKRYPNCVFADFEQIKHMDGEDFINKILLDRFRAQTVLCGFNFRFGKNASWSALDMRNYLEKKDVWVRILEHLDFDGEPISSTRIRKCVSDGKIEQANDMLGYNFTFESKVVSGDMRGRTIGFPTLNQHLPSGLVVPKYGVYESRTFVNDKEYKSFTNIGIRPTWRLTSPLSETHIFDFDKDIYGCTITVNLYKKLREVRKFNELSLLLEQITNDRIMAQEFWGLKQTNHTLHIDINRHCVILEQQEVYLSTNEFEVLYLLLQSPQTTFTKEQIYEQIWHEPTNNHLHAVENTIFQIRKRLKPYCMGHEYIKTVIGYGYKFNSE